MYELTVSDHIMIAHSLDDDFFGPARHLHGATYVVHAGFLSDRLTPKAVVLDIGVALDLLKEVLATVNYRNLDEIQDFRGQLTTTEFLASWIHKCLAERLSGQFQGDLRITLEESPVARVSYLASVP